MGRKLGRSGGGEKIKRERGESAKGKRKKTKDVEELDAYFNLSCHIDLCSRTLSLFLLLLSSHVLVTVCSTNYRLWFGH